MIPKSDIYHGYDSDHNSSNVDRMKHVQFKMASGSAMMTAVGQLTHRESATVSLLFTGCDFKKYYEVDISLREVA